MILHTKNRDFIHKLIFMGNIFSRLSVILQPKKKGNCD
jgi:hypothetical protein